MCLEYCDRYQNSSAECNAGCTKRFSQSCADDAGLAEACGEDVSISI